MQRVRVYGKGYVITNGDVLSGMRK